MPSPERGASLVELLISLALGLAVLLAASTALQATSSGHWRASAHGALLDPLRFSMARITQALSGAGFFPHVADPAQDIVLHDSVAGIRPCWNAGSGFALPATAVVASGELDRTSPPTFPCLRPSERLDGTDALLTLRAAATPTASRRDRRVYLRVDGRRSLLYVARAGAPAAWPDAAEHRLTPVLWFVRRYAHAPDEADPTPALCRKVLAPWSPPRMQSDPAGCIANGIEDLQLELGVRETDADALRFVEVRGAVDPDLLARTVAVRVHLVGRAPGRHPATGARITIGLRPDRVRTHVDGRPRRMLSSTVPLRNAAWRIAGQRRP